MTATPLTRLIARVLDQQWLSDQLGYDATAARLRIKPETSVTISVEDPSGTPVGWARWLWPISYSKAAKAQQQAAKLRLETIMAEAADGLLMQHGHWLADPRLAVRLHEAQVDKDAALLRYNPLRRVVLRDQDEVVRIEAADRALGWYFDQFIAAQIPTPQRRDDGERLGYSRYALTGEADLAARPDPAATRQAGELVARLHASAVPPQWMTALAGRAMVPMRQGLVHAALFDEIEPQLAVLTRRVIERLHRSPSAQPVLSHGDLSPDQFLIAPQQVWLTDFDRACLAPRATDLGSYLAVAGQELGQEFLTGYRNGGGQLPPAPVLQAAMADSLMLRAVDPLRLAQPDWADAVAANLREIERVLA